MSRKPENNTVAPDFDDDIIAEILLRLPANSLLRFRCVCKSWLALISAPSFVKNHLSRVNTKHFNLLVGTWPSQASVLKDDDGDIAITVLDYPVTSWSPCPALYPIIYGSCNGLMCIEFEYGNLILWKPCTRAFKQLPEPELDCREYGETFIYLAGFGYDSTIADYKVIRGSKINEDPTTLQVFTLKTGSWRTNPDFNHIKEGSECIFAVEKQGLLLNETLHWVALLRGPEYEKGTLGIVSIGLAEEKFQVMALFPCRRPSPDSFISTSIMTVGNSLFVYHEFDIWMMKEYGVEQSWTQVIYISPQILPFPQHVDYRLTPLCIFENGQILVNHGRTFGLYNPEEKTFKIVISNCEAYPRYYTAYVETLVLPLTGESKIASTVENKGAEMEILSLVVPPGWSKKGFVSLSLLSKLLACSWPMYSRERVTHADDLIVHHGTITALQSIPPFVYGQTADDTKVIGVREAEARDSSLDQIQQLLAQTIHHLDGIAG